MSVPTQEQNAIRFYAKPEISKITKVITSRDGDYLMVGKSIKGPILLVLDHELKEKSYTVYEDYWPGQFNDVIQRKDGTIVMVGHTMSEEYGAGEDDPNFLAVSTDINGKLIWQHHKDWYNFNTWNRVKEDEDGTLYLAGEALVTTLAGYSGILKTNADSVDSFIGAMWLTNMYNPFNEALIRANDVVFFGYEYANNNTGPINGLALVRSKTTLDNYSKVLYDQVPSNAFFKVRTNQKGDVLPVAGGYLMAHNFYNGYITPYLRLVKLDQSLNVDWAKDIDINDAFILSSIQEFDGNILISGATNRANTETLINSKAYVGLYTQDGNLIWEHEYGSNELNNKADYVTFENDKLSVLAVNKNSESDFQFFTYTLNLNGELQVP